MTTVDDATGADPVRRLYDGHFLSARGMSEEARRFHPERTLRVIEFVAEKGTTLHQVGAALAACLVDELDMTINGFQGEERFWPGIRHMVEQDEGAAWRLELAQRVLNELTAMTGDSDPDGYAMAFVSEVEPDTDWLQHLARKACEARAASMVDEIRWMISVDPATASLRHLAEAFALKSRIGPDRTAPEAPPPPVASLDILDVSLPVTVSAATVANLRLLVGRHGQNALAHLGWVLAISLDDDTTVAPAKVDGSEVGALMIEDMRIPVRGGAWIYTFGRMTETDAAVARAFFNAAVATLAGVIDLDENVRFGIRGPSGAQISKMARMVRAGVPVPDVQERISAASAWAYINGNNQDYLDRIRETGVFWSITQAAQALGVGRTKLAWWLMAHGYTDAYGAPCGAGNDVSLVTEGTYGTQTRWNSKFIETLKAKSAEISSTSKPR